MKFDSIKSELGPNDTTGDPEDQAFLTGRKVAKATETAQKSQNLASMLKAAAVKKKKKRGNS